MVKTSLNTTQTSSLTRAATKVASSRSSSNSNSFATQLSSALSAVRGRGRVALQAAATTAASQTVGTATTSGQNSVTSAAAATAAATTPAATAATGTTQSQVSDQVLAGPFYAAGLKAQAERAANPSATTTAATTTTTKLPELITTYNPMTASAAGAVLAKRPDAATLEYLKNTDIDIGQRQALAQALEQQGYTIDVAVDIWGWDPAKTSMLRAMYNYTWVPSATQQNVQVAPGLTAGALAVYNPSQAPAGAILVPGTA